MTFFLRAQNIARSAQKQVEFQILKREKITYTIGSSAGAILKSAELDVVSANAYFTVVYLFQGRCSGGKSVACQPM
jgi:hypothetical protein